MLTVLTANLTVRALPTLALPFPLEPLATAPPLVGTKADLWLEPEPEATGATSSSLSEMTISSMVDFMILSPREPGREVGVLGAMFEDGGVRGLRRGQS